MTRFRSGSGRSRRSTELFYSVPKRLLFATGILCILICGVGLEALAANASRSNVLFIAVDDLKPMLGCYGQKQIHSPNMDRLAGQGTVFLNAECQQAVCAPSRASLLTGLRPDTTEVWDLKTLIRDRIPDVVTLPQYFKQQGYESVGTGKIFDPRSVDGWSHMDAISWSRPYIHPEYVAEATFGYLDPALVTAMNHAKATAKNRKEKSRNKIFSIVGKRPTDVADVSDEAYGDGAMAAKGVELIEELAKGKKPFFLAIGFRKPHLPFNAPKKYWDLYDRNEIELATFQEKPAGGPDFHFQPGWELRSYTVPEQGPIPRDLQRQLIHGYYACVSYIDAQIGKLLDALDRTGLADNTVIVLWGDHGWHLGDHGMWCKHTNYEQATRAPLIIAAPRVGKPGGRSESPVEFVDIFPTLCDLTGVAIPKGLHGVSLRPILEDPSASVKPVAVSQYPRRASGKPLMGYSFRDRRYRYIEWVEKDYRSGATTGPVVATELYDYETDPLEKRNLIDDPAYADVIVRMKTLAREYHASD